MATDDVKRTEDEPKTRIFFYEWLRGSLHSWFHARHADARFGGNMIRCKTSGSVS